MKIIYGRKGLTLVETVISILMLGIIVVSMLGVFILNRIIITSAKHRTKAMNLVIAKMEWVKDQDYAIIEGWISSPIVEDNVDDTVGEDELLNDTRTTSVVKDADDNLVVTITLNWFKRAMGGTVSKGTLVNPDEQLVTLISP